ncbi:Protein zgrf1 [Elasticomyces elasticus]|nr:Protein zgrf1 [Elasticomyces elasticus]KAK3651059.1 Protein zgrf1 [Elasticomyces elasticus]KAK4931137.1 Protein zgrf1 [Elasticomyces elasticus]KAK5765605.1 Protein zgrf1 [Elasticomyces elasticus]
MSSNVFYDGKMTPAGDPNQWNTTLASNIFDMLKGPGFENAIHQRRLACQPRNRQFFTRLILLAAGVPSDDIGIISMYSEDVRRIVQQLSAAGVRNVAVEIAVLDPETSTVDAFQGCEKKIMLVRFVETFDKPRKHPFGFVRQSRRLNGATTRAQEYQFFFGSLNCWQSWNPGTQGKHDDTKHIVQLLKLVEEKGQIFNWSKLTRAAQRRHPEHAWDE